MLLNGKCQELPLGGSAQHAWHPRIEEPYDCLEHSVRRKGVALVDAQGPASGDAQHNGAVVMGQDAGNIAKSEQMEPVTEE